MPRTLSRSPQGDADDASTYAPDESTEPTEAPARRRVDTAKPRRGWGTFEQKAAAQAKKSDGKFPERLTLSNTPVLIKFLEQEPFDVWDEHWVEEAVGIRFPGADKPNKRKSFTCPTSLDEDASCPLCDALGDDPAPKVALNVAAWDPETKEWGLKVLDGRVRVGKAVKALTEGRNTKPINKEGLYFDASTLGTGTESQPKFDQVRQTDLEADLADDDIEDAPPPLTAEQIEEFLGNLWPTYARAEKRENLTAIVAALS